MSAGKITGPAPDPLYGPGPRPADPTDYSYMGQSRPLPAGYEWDPITQSITRQPMAAGARGGQALTGLVNAAPPGMFGFLGQSSSGGGPANMFPKATMPNPGSVGPPYPGVGVGGGQQPQGQLGAPFGMASGNQEDPSTNPALAGLLKSTQNSGNGR